MEYYYDDEQLDNFCDEAGKTLPSELLEKIVGNVEDLQYAEECYTCEHCGRVWDGNAQCYPCLND
jgi:uncharacterized protein with PIN domain